jgi:hypothetical protein
MEGLALACKRQRRTLDEIDGGTQQPSGTSSVAHLCENLAAAVLALPDDAAMELDNIAATAAAGAAAFSAAPPRCCRRRRW